ncbi:MAG: LysM peptidoglycan-binding domain-containing protein [Solirubrobacterales bacterium]
MANLIQNLTSISPEMRSGPSPGRRLLAVVLCAALVLGAIFPGFAVAGEADSEGEGTGTTIEVPVGPPDFEPGGEETELEEDAPAEGEEEGGAVEAEVEVEAPAESVTGTDPEAPVEATPPVTSPEPPAYAPEPEPTQQEEAQPAEPAPVEGQAIVAPQQEKRVEGGSASESASSDEAAAPPLAEPTQQEAPSPSPRPVASTPADTGRNLAGKDTYVVQPGDCLWRIAADLLGPGADTQAIEDEVGRLWRLNEDRIGTGDPNLIYAGTELRLR